MSSYYWPPTATTPAPRPYQGLTARQLNVQADRDRAAREQAHRRTLADLEATTATIRSHGPHARHRVAPGPAGRSTAASTPARTAGRAVEQSTTTRPTLASQVYARRAEGRSR